MDQHTLEGFRLSPQQRRIWALQNDVRGSISRGVVSLGPDVDPRRLEAALQALVERHEILRTRFRRLAGMAMPIQVIVDEAEIACDRVELAADSTHADVDQQLEALSREPFDLELGPTSRFRQVTSGEASYLLIAQHALLGDGRGLDNLVAELADVYAEVGADPPAAPAPGGVEEDENEDGIIQYADVAEWQNEVLEDEEAAEGLGYWRRRNLSAMSTWTLPGEKAPNGNDGREADAVERRVQLRLDTGIRGRLEKLAEDHETSLATVLLAVLQTLIHRLTGAAGVVVGVGSDGRQYEGLGEAIGLFGKVLPVESHFESSFTFGEILAQAARNVAEAEEWEDYLAWDDVQEPPAFAAIVESAPPAGRHGPFTLRRNLTRTEPAMLRLVWAETDNGLKLEIEADGGRFSGAATARLAGQIETVLRTATGVVDVPVAALDVLGAEERRRLLETWNATETVFDTPAETTLHAWFETQAQRTPDALAVVGEDSALSFEQLDRRANRWAHRLQELGVEAETRVVLCLDRSPEIVVGVLAVLKAGGAYVPLDPGQPAVRLGGMATEVLAGQASSVVLTQSHRAPGLAQQLGAGARVLNLDLDADFGAMHDDRPPSRATADNAAYLIFTSGSTGRPKGSVISHRSAINLASALRRQVYEGVPGGSRVSLNAPFSFDASVKQWIQVLFGDTLCVVPEEIRLEGEAFTEWLALHRVDVLDCTPSQLRLLLDAGLDQAWPRRVLVGGEAIDPATWQSLANDEDRRYVNVYGPTECTVDTTVCPVAGDRPILGRPIGNVRTYVVDPGLRPVPQGVAGELVVAGAGVARGYHGRGGLSAERFVPDLFATAAFSGGRLYRTGDRVRYTDDGALEFLGRLDHQVKLRGIRVELGEIEAALLSHPAVAEAVAVVRKDDDRLVVYVTGRVSSRSNNRCGPRRHLLPNGLEIAHQNRNETDYLYQEIFTNECYALHGVELPEDAVVLDVGANIGMFSLFVGERAPRARVYAFEPLAPIRECLSVNAALSACEIEVLPYGLAASERVETLLYYPRYSMMSGQSDLARPDFEAEVIKRFLRNEEAQGSGTAAALLAEADELLAGRFEGKEVECRLRRLSDVLCEHAIEHVDLLKIDVQRAELDVIRGLDEGDWSRIDQIVMEVHDAPDDETSGQVPLLEKLLGERGFTVVVEQDELLTGTDRYNLYAVRPDKRRQPIARRPELVSTRESEPMAMASSGELREWLRQRLPDYMMPSAFVELDELLLTRRGKVDRRALPAPESVEAAFEEDVVEPSTPFEEMLAAIWGDLLGAERVGADGNFFELGGHSLLATQLMARVRETFQVDLPLRTLFETPTVLELAAQIAHARRTGAACEMPPITAQPRDRALPLSFAQERLWTFENLMPGNPAYTNLAAQRVRGALDVSVMAHTLSEIYRRHEVQRTTFDVIDGLPVQVPQPASALDLPVVDLGGLAPAAREAEVRRLTLSETRQPFDLSRGPLIRPRLLHLADDEFVILLAMHHITCDAWSLGILAQEVVTLYEAFAAGRPSPLPELTLQYADFASWQRDWLAGDLLDEQLAYWLQQLSGVPPVLELTTDRLRPSVQSFRGRHLPIRLGRELSLRLAHLGREQGVTLYMTLLAAFQALLARTTGQRDILVGSPVADRPRPEVADLIGFFVNTVVMRGRSPSRRDFRELLAATRETALEAYAHQDLPFEMLVAALDLERHLSRTPLFQVMFALHNVPSAEVEISGLRFESVELDWQVAKFDLTWVMSDRDGELQGFLEYNSELFDRTTVARFSAHLAALLEGAVADPDRRLDHLPLLGAGERHQLQVEWHGPEAPLPRPVRVHELVAARAAATPDALAVSWQPTPGAPGELITYGELDRRAEQLAGHLRSLGVGSDVAVAIWMERSCLSVLAMLSVLKAGGAYLPIDPAEPAERLAYKLKDARAPVFLTQKSLAGGLPTAVSAATEVLILDRRGHEGAGEQIGDGLSRATDENLAYVIYTSGSTGLPKGTELRHVGLANLVHWHRQAYELTPEDRGTMLSGPGFDASVWEVWPYLAAGAGLCIPPAEIVTFPERLAAWLSRQRITVSFLATPLAEAMLLEAAGGEMEFGHLRALLTGGDRLHQRSTSGAPGQLINHYGPTEDSVVSTAGVVVAGDGPPSIGRPITNTRAAILDADLEPVPTGVPGELFVGGVGLARGYLSRRRLTAASFLPDPFSRQPGARLYRTGDRVRWLADGEIDFLGRGDDQVSIRGFRIELGEIETLLDDHPEVRQAVVMVDDGPQGERLWAYVVPSAPADAEPWIERLRTDLKERLPGYMVPAGFQVLPSLPLTRNGKVDRRALPGPEQGAGERTDDWPATPTEGLLMEVWCEVLDLPRVGVSDDFFELGGHSLLATRVLARVRRVFGVEMPLRSLFERPRVADLAREIDRLRALGPGLDAARIRRQPRDEPPPLSFAQQRLWFLDRLEPDSAAYNIPIALELEGNLDVAVLERALGEIVRRHATLRTTVGEVDGEAFQCIGPPAPVSLPMVDLESLPESARRAEARHLMRQESLRPFDLKAGPVYRFTLLRLGAERHGILATLHHIVSDAWSMAILTREVSRLYRAFSADPAAEDPLPELPVQYADFAAWQRQWLQGEAMETMLRYWRRQLGSSPVLELPFDRPRQAVQSLEGATVEWSLDETLSRGLRDIGRRQGATLFMTLLAVFKVLLARLSGQPVISVGSPIAGRGREEIEDLIGFFVNTLVYATDLGDNPDFLTLLERLRERGLEAHAHQELPFEKLVDELDPERSLSRSPLFQVMFSVANAPREELSLPGLVTRSLDVVSESSKFDLNMTMVEGGDGRLHGTLSYSTRLFDRTTILRLVASYQRLLAGAIGRSEDPVGDLPMWSVAQRSQVLIEWNQADPRRREVMGDRAVVWDLFAAQAARTPEATALRWQGERIAYRQLQASAEALAERLRDRGVGPDCLVGICLDRRPELVQAILGVLAAGGAYLPLDPSYPRERLALMLEDAEASEVLSDESLLPLMADLGVEALCLDGVGNAPIATFHGPRVDGDNLAVLIYTSGSTGRPKGAALTQKAVVAVIHWGRDFFTPAELSGVLAGASVNFDDSIFQLLATLGCGGTVILADDALALIDLPERDEVTLVKTVPTAMAELMRQGGLPASVLTVGLGGEPLRASLAKTVNEGLVSAGPPPTGGPAERRLVNFYGPAEDTVWDSFKVVRPGVSEDVTIGRPMDQTRFHLLGRRGDPVPFGAVGEVCIGGMGLARGYFGRPALSAERFVPDALSRAPGERLYRSGDLARYLADGEIMLLGRIDHQVKVRGYRIELGEIEAVLLEQPAVAEAAVAVHTAEGGQRQLVAYVARAEQPTAEGLDVAALKQALQARLPQFMIPNLFVELPTLPRIPSGKIDRNALPAPDLTPQSRFVAPEQAAETRLAKIFSEVLGLPDIGVEGNFFELGGDSILSLQIVARANRAGFSITPKDIFLHPTIAELVALPDLRRNVHAEQGPVLGSSPLTPIQHWFFERFEDHRHHFNQSVLLAIHGDHDPDLLAPAVAHLVAHHDVLRSRFRRADAGWVQDIQDVPSEVRITRRDFSSLGEEAFGLAVEDAAADAQASLDIEHGPLFQVVYLQGSAAAGSRLLIAVHHLVVDGVSWRILLEDLQEIYDQLQGGSEVELPSKTTSFRYWSERLAGLADAEGLREQLDHWHGSARAEIPPLRLDDPDAVDRDTVAAAGTVSATLTPEETRALLQEVPQAYRTEINDVLLTALVRAMEPWNGAAALRLDLEGHGREDLFDDVDLSRTVGWFTALYPVALDVRDTTGPGEALQCVKAALREIPERGIGHGILRYLGGDEMSRELRRMPAAEVSFSYLGQTDQTLEQASLFTAAPETGGARQDPSLLRPHRLEITAVVADGRFRLSIRYGSAIHRRVTVESLLGAIFESLRELIEHCRSAEAGGFTATDFPLLQMEDDELALSFDEIEL